MVFSANFVNSLKMVNDKKSRHDHETGNTHKHFWIRAALAYNNRHDDDVVRNVNEVMHDTIDTAAVVASQFNAEEMEDESVNVDAALGVTKNSSTDGIVLDEFSLIVVPTNDPYLADLEDNKEVDLDKFEMMETSAFRKKILDLFKICSTMKKNMMRSGTHDNDAFNFVEVAMREFHRFTPIAVYYFYTRCEEHTDIDCIFQPTMDESLKGNSISVQNEDSDSLPSSAESKLT